MMSFRALCVVIVLMVALMPVHFVMAQDVETDEEKQVKKIKLKEIVVESVSRVATPVSEVTRSVTVVTNEELLTQSRLDRSAGSVLAQKVPGFSPSTVSLTNYGQTLRGRNFQTLIDGVPQDTPLRNGIRSLQSIDINAVEQIEIIRGGTAVYGFGAEGGLINYITKRPEDGAVNVLVSGGLGFSTVHANDSIVADTHLQVSGRRDKVDYLLDGTFVDRNNTFDADGNRRLVDPVGRQGGLDESREYNLLAKLGYQFDDRQRLEASFNYFNLRQDADYGGRSSVATGELYLQPPIRPEIAVPGNVDDVDPGNETINLNLVYSNEDILGSYLKIQGYYQFIDTTFTLFPGFLNYVVESKKLGVRTTVNTPVSLPNMPFEVTWGLDYLKDDTSQYDVMGDVDPNANQDAIAGFAQVEIPVGELGILTGGMRHESMAIDVTGATPNVTGELSASETLFNASASAFLTEQLTLFGGFSESFSPGDVLRQVNDNNETFATVKDVEFEFVHTSNYEAGLRAESGTWNASLIGFFSTTDNGTNFDADLNIVTQPERIYGLEASASGRPVDKLQIGGTFTWMHGEIDNDNDGTYDEDLPSLRIPPVKVTGSVSYEFLDWLSAGTQVFYSGTQTNNSGLFGGGCPSWLDYCFDIDSYFLVDLFSNIDVGPGVLNVNVTNLFNNAYLPLINQAYHYQFSNVQGPGRRLTLAYTMKF